MDGILGNYLEDLQVRPPSDDNDRIGRIQAVPAILLEAPFGLGYYDTNNPVFFLLHGDSRVLAYPTYF